MNKKVFRTYCSDSLYLNAPFVVNTMFTLATLPIVLASLPVSDYGKWQLILALQIWLFAATASNINYASKRGIARGLNGTFLYAFFARLKLLVPVGVLVFVIAFFLKRSQGHVFSTLLVIMGVYLISGYLFSISFYDFLVAKKRFKKWCFLQILTSSISIMGSALVAVFTRDILYFVSFQLGSNGIISCIVWLRIVGKEKLMESYKIGKIDKECVPYGLKVIPVDLASITADKIPHFIIGYFLGYTTLAIFSVANKLREKATGLIKNIRPLLYADFAKMQKKELLKIVNRHLVKIGVLGVLLTSCLIGAGWFYIKFFLPTTFHQAIFYFTILVLGFPPRILVIVLHTVLESHLRYKELTAIGIIPSALKIVLILILGYFSQIIGVCVALAISGWVTFGFYYLLTFKIELVIKFIDNHPWIKKLSKKY